MTAAQKHIPVMLKEVLEHLSPQDGETYVDATFGNGGYSEAILKAANCRLIAIDRDPTVLPRVEELKENTVPVLNSDKEPSATSKILLLNPSTGRFLTSACPPCSWTRLKEDFPLPKTPLWT